MSVKVDLEYDTKKADAQLEASQKKAADGFAQLGAKLDTSIKFEKVVAGLQGVAGAAAAIVPNLAGAESALTAIVSGGASAAGAGAAIGAAFTPLGAVIGFALGAAAGAIAAFFKRAKDEAAAAKKSIMTVNDETKILLKTFGNVELLSLGEAVAETKALEDKIEAVNVKLREGGPAVFALINQLRDLETLKFERAARSLELINIGAKDFTKSVEEMDRELYGVPKTMAELTTAVGTTSQSFTDAKDKYNDFLVKLKSQVSFDMASISEFYKEFNQIQSEVTDAFNKRKEAGQALIDATDAKTAKAQAAEEKRVQSQIAMHDKNLSAKARADQQYVDSWLKINNTAYLASQEEIEWQEKVAAVTIEVNLRRTAADLERIKIKRDMIAEERRLEEEAAERRRQDISNLASEYQSFLTPFANVLGSTFTAVTDNIEKGNRALAGVGKAFKLAVAESLSALSKQWGIQSLAELAASLASFAFGDIKGGTQHGSAAVLYGAAAAAAGIGGAVIRKNNPSPKETPSSAGSAGNPSLGSPGRSQSRGGTIEINMTGNMFLDGDDRSMAKAGKKLGTAISTSRNDSRIDY